MKAPTLPSLFVSHWHLAWSLSVTAASSAAVYVAAARRLRGRWPRGRTLWFLAGLAVVLVALESGVDDYDDRLLSVHMVQHMMLLLAAPPLLIAGRPLLLALRALPPPKRAPLARAVRRLRPVAGPWQGLAFYCGVVLLTHLPGLYDLTLTHPAVHDAEHVLYVLAGSLLLWPLLEGDPVPSHQLSGVAKLIYMLVAMVPMAVVGAYLNRHTAVVYQSYGPAAHALGVSALSDQATAGAIMWVVGNTLMVGIGLWAVMAALLADEQRQRARDARLAAPRAGAGEP